MLAGNYRDTYLIYGRKSTDEADNQKNSISYQRSENARYADREKLPVALITIKGFCADGIVSEKHSGFTEDNDISITDDGLVQSRCVNGCENTFKNFNFDYIEEKVGHLISGLYFTDDEIEQMDGRAGTEIALLEEKRLKIFD